MKPSNLETVLRAIVAICARIIDARDERNNYRADIRATVQAVQTGGCNFTRDAIAHRGIAIADAIQAALSSRDSAPTSHNQDLGVHHATPDAPEGDSAPTPHPDGPPRVIMPASEYAKLIAIRNTAIAHKAAFNAWGESASYDDHEKVMATRDALFSLLP